MEMKVQLLHENATVPVRATEHAAAYDLTAISSITIESGKTAIVGTGVAVQVPPGHYGQIAGRSGMAFHRDLWAFPGVIDADYRGEIRVLLANHGGNTQIIGAGDRVAQLLILPCAAPTVVVVPTLETSVRGESGFGSTGK
jgi:dUTP pyrophosphatase